MNLIVYQKAISQIGVKEIVGAKHNPTIVSYAHSIGLKWINDDETPWCAVFVNWTLKECGYKYLVSARARDFEKYGKAVTTPEIGDIAVFHRGGLSSGLGHVTFFCGFDAERKILGCGGNQGNQVTLTPYGDENLIGYRRISEAEDTSLTIPEKVLKRGDKSQDVKKLQYILKFLELYTKPIDDIFGPGVEAAIKSFQIQRKLPVTGIYDKATKDKLFLIFNE